MRLVLAIITFVAAAILLALGIGIRVAPETVQKYDYSVESTGSAPVTIIDGTTLNALDGRQTMTISGSGEIVAAYARRADVLAWIGEASYNEIAFLDENGEACAPDPLQPELCALESIRHAGTETTVPDPYGADLWMEDYRDTGSLRMTETLPSDLTYVIASDGTSAAPRQIEIAWPTPAPVSREFSAWFIIAGAVLGVIGLVLLLTAIHRMRGGGGPKRRMPKVPKVPTIKSVRSPKVAARAGTSGTVAIIAALAVGALAFSPVSSAQAATTPTPTPTPGTSEPGLPIPALDERQVRRIVDRAVTTVTAADATNDAELAATRVAGPALELKTADYLLRSRDGAQIASTPVIPTDGEIVLSLPQQVPANSTAWPRRLFVVIAQPQALEGGQPAPTSTPTPTPGAEPTVETAPAVLPPVAMVLTQAEPRSDYKITYLVALQADIPEVPATEDGTAVLPPDSSLVSYPIADVASAYVDILVSDTASESYEAFDVTDDRFVLGWGLVKQQAQQANQQAQESPNNMAFSTVAGENPPVALATTEGGALVFGTVRQTVDVTPAEAGAKVIAQGAINLLSGVERSERGYTSVYAGQLLFYVPPLDSDDPIVVLGYSGGIVSSAERP
ncbi:MAG TPA: hypothetical protein VNQ52_07770 [Microbacteriaceae bacterium]|nr:hypothetical protein [Microbacteriaceae bacterium]